MLNWALKQWLFQPARLLLTMVVFAGVLAVAMLFDGIRIGIAADMREFPASLASDLVGVKAGNNYFAMGPSSLPLSTVLKITSVAGVESVAAIAMAPFILANNDKRTPAMLVAYDTIGGPQKFVSGRAPTEAAEIAMDAKLAKLNGLKTGDEVEVLGAQLKISGLTLGTTSAFTPYNFVTFEGFGKIVGEMAMNKEILATAPDMSLVSALLINIADGTGLADLRARLNSEVPAADFFTPEEIGDADADFVDRLMGPVLVLLSGMT